ncbi:MAG: sugar ABC transporter substrate-binding protein [Chloroflexi bacterium]|nr:sugar ABC transporter substrate-binding protein [Chloroflexota bacterium]
MSKRMPERPEEVTLIGGETSPSSTLLPGSPSSLPPTRRSFLSSGLALLTGAGALGALAACGPAGQPDTKPATEAAGTIDFWHWGSQDYFERYRNLADEFQKRHPKFTVEVLRVDPGMTEKLLTASAAGSAPQTFVIDFQWAQSFAHKGFAEFLDDRIKKSRILKMNEYSKLATDAISYRGKFIGLPGVGIPGGAAPNLVFYNADLFRQAGLQTPHELWKKDQWTWAAFVQACERLVKRDGTKMTLVPVDEGQHRLWMNTAGGKEADDVFAPTKSFYDAPQSIKALQFLQDLRHKHRVVPVGSVNSEVGLGTDDAFKQGRLVMRFRWTTGINVYRDINSFKWGMAPYPKDATYANDYTAAGLAISKGAKQQDAAWAWIEWASSPEGQKIDAVTTTGVPFNPEAQKVFTESLKKIPVLETPDTPVELIAGAKHSFLRLLSIDEMRIRAETIDPHTKRLWANEINGQTAGKNIAEAMNEFLKANPQK